MNTDPIADLLTRIRNASRAGHESLTIPYSRLKEEIVQILSKRGFVGAVKIVRDQGFSLIRVYLLPTQKNISLIRKSKPGRRLYVSHKEIRPVKNGYGVGIISTSKGVITSEDSLREGIGGEYLCEVF